MTMSPRRLLRCGLVFAALTMVGCDLDELNHGCEVLHEIHWDQKIQSMHFVHEDPSKCPIPIPEADGIQNRVFFSGTAVDEHGDEYAEGDGVSVDVTNGSGGLVGSWWSGWFMSA